jgi:hypothetical protein
MMGGPTGGAGVGSICAPGLVGTFAGVGSTWALATAAPLMAVADATAAMMPMSLLLYMMLPPWGRW